MNVENRDCSWVAGWVNCPCKFFKFELSPIGDFTTRTYLQIHPDGFCDGTAGCVGIQAFDDCCKVLYLVRHYFQTRLLVD